MPIITLFLELVLFIGFGLIAGVFFLLSMYMHHHKDTIRECIGVTWVNRVRDRISNKVAKKIASILGYPANTNNKLVDWVRFHSTNLLIFVVGTLFTMRYIQLQFSHVPLPYSDVIQAIGSFFLAVGSIYMARNSFKSKYMDSNQGNSNLQNEKKDLFVFVKGFSFLFWGASILLIGYLFPIWEFIYSSHIYSLPISEIYFLILLIALFIIAMVGVVDAVIPALSTTSVTFGIFTFIFGILVNTITLLLGFVVMIVTIAGFLDIYESMEFNNPNIHTDTDPQVSFERDKESEASSPSEVN